MGERCGQGPTVDFYKHGDKPLSSLKARCFDRLLRNTTFPFCFGLFNKLKFTEYGKIIVYGRFWLGPENIFIK